MTQNSNLVEYFISEFYMNKTADLAHIASPSFKFKLNNSKSYNFQNYADSMLFLTQNAEIEFGDVNSVDDVTFVSKWAMFMKIDNGKIDQGLGYTEFQVKKGMLNLVRVVFDAEEEFFKYYNKLYARKYGERMVNN